MRNMGKQHIASIKAKNKAQDTSSHFTQDFIHDDPDLTMSYLVSLAESVRAAVCFWLPDTTRTFVNQRYLDIFDKDADDILGKKWISDVPVAEQKEVKKVYEDLAKNPKAHIRERSFIDEKNEIRHIEWTDYPVADENGKVIKFLSIGRDVTEEKKNKEALVDIENRNSQLIESMQEGLVMQDENGTVTYVNDSFLNITGCERKNLIGKSVYTLVCIDEGISDILISQAQRQNRMDRKIHDLELGSGSKVSHIQVSTIPITDQKGISKGSFTILTDISQRKRSEERLKKINDCLLNLGPDASKNIQLLTRLFGEVMGATCALYNRLEGDSLYSYGQWRTPEDYESEDKADGHICYDVIKNESDQPFIVRNLPQTAYYFTDPNVSKYKLETYVGQAVRSGREFVGSLCAVFQKDVSPSKDDLKVMGIIAAAISSEEEREEARLMIRNKMDFQNTISKISSRFVGNFDFDSAIRSSLAEIGELSGADRVHIFLVQDDGYVSSTHDWCAHGLESQVHKLQKLSAKKYKWFLEKLGRSQIINIEDVKALPKAASAERELIEGLGIKSLVAFPIFVNNKLIGFMGLDKTSDTWGRDDTDLPLLRVCAEIFGNALEIKQAESEIQQALDKVRVTKKEWEITVDSLPQIICLLDKEGRIVRANRPIEDWGVSNLRDAKDHCIHDVFHPKCKKKRCELKRDIDNIWKKSLKGESGELIHKCESLGKTICVKMHPHVKAEGVDDSKYAAIAVVYDITEKVKANQKIFEMFKYLGLINRKVSILLDMRKGGTKKNSKDVYSFIVQSSMQIADAKFSLLYEFDDKERTFDMLDCGGALSRSDKDRLQIIEGDKYDFVKKMVRHKKRAQGVASDEVFHNFVVDNKFEKTVQTCLAVPLLFQDKLKGMLILGFDEEHNLSTQELEFYDLFALQSCLVLMNVWTNEEK